MARLNGNAKPLISGLLCCLDNPQKTLPRKKGFSAMSFTI
jgi:hypothetical protein